MKTKTYFEDEVSNIITCLVCPIDMAIEGHAIGFLHCVAMSILYAEISILSANEVFGANLRRFGVEIRDCDNRGW